MSRDNRLCNIEYLNGLLRHDLLLDMATNPENNSDHDGRYLNLDGEGTNVTNGTFDLTTTGFIEADDYNTLSILPVGSYTYLSGDGFFNRGLTIAIPINVGGDFSYGWNGTEHHKFGSSGQVEISDDGLITAISLAVDTDTLVVDAVNHRVGIGTVTPSALLDVNGDVDIAGSTSIGEGVATAGKKAFAGGNTATNAEEGGVATPSITATEDGSLAYGDADADAIGEEAVAIASITASERGAVAMGCVNATAGEFEDITSQIIASAVCSFAMGFASSTETLAATAVNTFALGRNFTNSVAGTFAVGFGAKDFTISATTLTWNGIAKLGDGGVTNYSEFESDGTLNLYGSARVKKQIPIDNANLGKGSTKPTQVIIGNYNSWEFGINDDSVFTIHLPHEWAVGTDVIVNIDWYIDESAGDEIKWEITWSATPHNSTEVIDSAGTSVDTGDIVIPTTPKYFTTNSLTISGGSLSADDQIGITLKRIAITDGTNPANEPAVVDIHIEYTADKFGEPLP